MIFCEIEPTSTRSFKVTARTFVSRLELSERQRHVYLILLQNLQDNWTLLVSLRVTTTNYEDISPLQSGPCRDDALNSIMQ